MTTPLVQALLLRLLRLSSGVTVGKRAWSVIEVPLLNTKVSKGAPRLRRWGSLVPHILSCSHQLRNSGQYCGVP